VLLSARDVETALTGVPFAASYAHPGAGVVQAGPWCLATYWVAAGRHGHDFRRLAGTGQSDFFLTYVGCMTREQIPPRIGLRFNCDLIEFCVRHMPRWIPVSIAGYNGADSGLDATQELAAVMANAVEQADAVLARGHLAAEDFVGRIGGINLRTSMAFFEDIAKLRAARKMWSDLLASRYGVTDEKARRLRIHVVTAGSAMTYQQPLNNIVRGTLMALVAALGGTQSLGVSGYDEALSIPGDHAHQMSIRIQQILQHECEGLLDVADPLGGSFFLEHLTQRLEERAWTCFDAIQARGGFVAAIDDGWLQQQAMDRQLADSAALATGAREVVGVNCATDDVTPWSIDGFAGGADAWDRGMARLADLRATRDGRAAAAALSALADGCRRDAGIVALMLDAVAADVSIGEVGAVFREVFGTWDAPIPI
jgi:methylmalonyl-CoA mutase N-terminal domain/subunit